MIHRSRIVVAAVILGIASTMLPLLFAATSAEAQRRILNSTGIDPNRPKQVVFPDPWQGPRVLFLLSTTVASAIGLTLAVVAQRRQAGPRELIAAAFASNVAGLICSVFLAWCIS
jgi:hypothetical protein